MSALAVFTFENFEVRVAGTPGKPEWVAADVCKVLDIANSRDTLARFEEDERGVVIADTLGGNQEMATVTEAGLYRLIFKSRKPAAKRFQRWVFHEVLPTLRKTGSYSVEVEIPPVQKLAAIASLPPAAQKQHILQTSYEFLERTGGVDERDRLLFRDSFRNIALADRLQAPALPAATGRLEWPVSDRANALGYRPHALHLQKIGSLLAKMYQTRHGRPPVKREQFVGGTTRMVNVYGEADLDLMDRAIREVMGEVG